MSAIDHSTHDQFYEYYANASQSEKSLQRFRSIRECVLRVARKHGLKTAQLEVVDIGCGAGTHSLLWAELGHKVHGLDVNGPLLELARQRSSKQGYEIDFQIGTATKLPWSDRSTDICLMLELLEHVGGWKECLQECARILRPGGILFLTTSNKLCPLQQEFNLPLYSWYPRRLKRHFEKLAVTGRPDLVNFAKYPAVNWFSFFGLRATLARYGFKSLDRFDIMDLSHKGILFTLVMRSLRRIFLLRWLAHVATEGTILIAVKKVTG
jgi:2-polyprenyl-6-hydroxyphenyl methylase/3-demethylubiquinone-9 3-methyltransferase